MNIQQAEL